MKELMKKKIGNIIDDGLLPSEEIDEILAEDSLAP